jgi:V/A-type H+/Na+-transporting ATPase subunit F
MKLAIIGGKTSVEGLKSLGVDAFSLDKPADATGAWKSLALDDYAIIFLTEPVYQVLLPEIEAMPRRLLPVISVVPAVTGSRNVGQQMLRKLVEKAVGTDMMFRD